jgi:hypothetical protein
MMSLSKRIGAAYINSNNELSVEVTLDSEYCEHEVDSRRMIGILVGATWTILYSGRCRNVPPKHL